MGHIIICIPLETAALANLMVSWMHGESRSG